MPIRRVPSSFPDLESAIELIEESETILSVTSDGAGSLFIATAPKAKRSAPGSKETRGMVSSADASPTKYTTP